MRVAKICLLVIVAVCTIFCLILFLHEDRKQVELAEAEESVEYITDNTKYFTDSIDIDKLLEKFENNEEISDGDTGYKEINDDSLNYISENEKDNYTCYDNTFLHDGNQYYRKNIMNVDVLFVDYLDCAVYNDQNKILGVQKTCEIVKDYYYEISRGNLTINFNYFYYQNVKDSYNNLKSNILAYINQFQINERIYNEGKQNGTPLDGNNGAQADVKMIVHSVQKNDKAVNYSSIFWPKVNTKHNKSYEDSDLVIMNSDYIGEINSKSYGNNYCCALAHEFGHALGLKDLYIVANSVGALDPIGYYSLYPEDEGMSLDPSSGNLMDHQTQWVENENIKITPMNVQNRFLLGWLGNVSNVEDEPTTAIKKITKTGSYILQPNTFPEGTICYKFGQQGNEFFMIENSNDSGNRYLKVYRVNMTKDSNWLATSESSCYIYSIRDQNRNLCGTSSSYFGGKNSAIRYANGDKADFMIYNITINKNGTITFNFEVGDDIITDTPDVQELEENSFYFRINDENGNFINISQFSGFVVDEDDAIYSWNRDYPLTTVYVNDERYYYVKYKMPTEDPNLFPCFIACYGQNQFRIDPYKDPKFKTFNYQRNFGDIINDSIETTKKTLINFFGNLFA